MECEQYEPYICQNTACSLDVGSKSGISIEYFISKKIGKSAFLTPFTRVLACNKRTFDIVYSHLSLV